MLSSNYLAILYLLPAIGFVVWYLKRHRRVENDSQQVLQSSLEDGLLDPATLHPDIDPTICIGCGACVAACPERGNGPVLGLIKKKARLIGPSHCIGHGACHASCPVDAITLVFGTATRGVDIPFVKPDFETNVPGVYIAGELGGMGLIRNAVEQGRQAMDSIAALVKVRHQNDFDVVVVGAGPAGFSASLRAIQVGLRVATIEQDSLGGSIAHFPRQKIVMTQPAHLPIVGRMSFRDVNKQTLIEFWSAVERQTGLSVNYCERVDALTNRGGEAGFIVSTNKRSYSARAVLLAIGRRGTPRRLEVPGEDLPKVAYSLIEPEQYRGQHVLVVGGGDSALEATISLTNVPDTKIILSYRSEAFSRARKRNRDQVLALEKTGALMIIYRSVVRSIQTGSVSLQTGKSIREYPNDSVIIAAGGVLPSSFLRAIGIDVETKWGTA